MKKYIVTETQLTQLQSLITQLTRVDKDMPIRIHMRKLIKNIVDQEDCRSTSNHSKPPIKV